MFGLVIITKKKYDALIECEKKHTYLNNKYIDARDEMVKFKEKSHAFESKFGVLEKRYASLEKEKADLEAKVKEQAVKLNEQTVMNNRRCDGCPDETPTCKKLYTGEVGTVCVEGYNGIVKK